MKYTRLQLIDLELIKLQKTKKEIADELGMHHNSISDWCRGNFTSKRIEDYFANLISQKFVDKLPKH